MARLINLTRRDIVLQTRHVVPALEQLDTTNEVIRCTDNWPRLNGLIIAGDLVAEYDDAPAAALVATREPTLASAEPAAAEKPATVKEPAPPKAARQKS